MNHGLILTFFRVQNVLLMALIFMWLMPYGTFDPSKLGFYMSIICAVMTEVLTWTLLKKFRTKQ